MAADMNYGFIGLGNMGGAILSGMASSGRFDADSICGFNRSSGKTAALSQSTGLIPRASAAEVVKTSDVVVLSVKPQMMQAVMDETAPLLSPEQTVITIAAGLPCAWYEDRLGEGVPVVRVMPNIAAKVQRAVTAICAGKFASEEHLAAAEKIFSTVGSVYRVEESMFSAFSAIGGASGAFIDLYIDALAEAGVKAGFPRKFACAIAADAVLGAAELVKQSGEHPIELCDRVCSPGGTTIEGVLTLKRLGFESAVQQATQAIIDKDKSLGK
jgi:pyrroline-5-carboxylate reductase